MLSSIILLFEYFCKAYINQCFLNNDVLTANTRLEEKRLDLPLEDYLMDLYFLGLSEAGILSDGMKLTAQQTWPFVAAAYGTQGTPRPCWFMIKECDEINKLISFIKQVYPIAKGYYKKRHETLIKMLEPVDTILAT